MSKYGIQDVNLVFASNPIEISFSTLKLDVEYVKDSNILKINLTNLGSDTVLYPDLGYGLKLEKRINNTWELVKDLYSIFQAIGELDPSETIYRDFNIVLESGLYKVSSTSYGLRNVDHIFIHGKAYGSQEFQITP